jgi:hypothetical protein
MDVLGDIRLAELVGDLTVATFLILLAASVVMVSSMIITRLIDVAFKKKSESRDGHRATQSRGEGDWLTKRPWLAMRANTSQRELLNYSGFGRGKVVQAAEQFSEAKYWTPLIKLTVSPVRGDERSTVVMKEGHGAFNKSPTSNAAPETTTIEAA